jgi:hypothetical protein
MMEKYGSYEFNDGFMPRRRTDIMAVSLTRDVIAHCVYSGTPMLSSSLEAEGAFDAIPHSILFDKSMSVIADHFWRILVFWCSKIIAYMWNGSIGYNLFTICKVTRQGGRI